MQIGSNEEPIEKSFENLRELLKNGRLIAFVGAGASIGARIRDGAKLTLPSAAELGQKLAQGFGFTDDEVNPRNLLDVASAASVWAGRYFVEEYLEGVFAVRAEPKPFHRWLAAQGSIHLIMTTNYDSLIEQACRDAGRQFHVIMPARREDFGRDYLLWWQPAATEPILERVKRIDLDPRDSLLIYKMHGGVDPTSAWQSSVTTEEDYFDVACRVCDGSLLPPGVAYLLSASSLLFVGYSLRDVHVRRLLYQMSRFADRKHYVVNKTIGRMDEARFYSRKFRTLEMSADDFVKKLDSNEGT